MPNNKQKTYFRKAIGCARLAYNWGLAEWERRYKEGERGINARKLLKDFNAIRKERFPFTYEVTKYATAHSFTVLEDAYKRFFKGVARHPKFHKKKNDGSFYMYDDHGDAICEKKKKARHLKGVDYNINGKHQYLKIANLGYVKMSERLRFNGKLEGIVIKQEGEKFFAYFSMTITEEEYKRTHKQTIRQKKGERVGIDLGVKEEVTLSDGIAIHNPSVLEKHQRKITRLSRQLNKRQHARTKQERSQGVKQSKNYKKLSIRLRKEYRKVADVRRDFIHKLTTVITTYYSEISYEDLYVDELKQKSPHSGRLADASLGSICQQIEYKAPLNGCVATKADKWYASSKICSACGKKHTALTLNDRTFVCPHCGFVIDRDYNAALNLLSLIQLNVGAVRSELTPVDLTALHSRFSANGIATSKIESGRQRSSLWNF